MKKCEFDPNAGCSLKKTTKINCLTCILSNHERHYGKLLDIITSDFKVPIRTAGLMYRLLSDIFRDNVSYLKWVKKFYPAQMLDNSLNVIVKKQLKRFDNMDKKMVV